MVDNKTFTLKIVTVSKPLFEGEAVELHAKGTDGQMVILAHHTPFITRVEKSTLRVLDDQGEMHEYPIISGILEVANNKAVVLCSAGE
ncbi:hypothetical protein COB18_01420 [Candidatus Kaiserbacteria bacterium]|nr:MAG: hypothetical protein COB80_02525 [Candidatus Kaiserbacteria bacterium]PCI90388.1 MAG: hypothetical protein COB18_01420 [Candidatus Kaiserbacteria bacterium]